MDDIFEIPVVYKEREYSFEAQLFTTTYTYQIHVWINDAEFSFERDDSGDFRAVSLSPDNADAQRLDPGLLQAISTSLEEILS